MCKLVVNIAQGFSFWSQYSLFEINPYFVVFQSSSSIFSSKAFSVHGYTLGEVYIITIIVADQNTVGFGLQHSTSDPLMQSEDQPQNHTDLHLVLILTDCLTHLYIKYTAEKSVDIINNVASVPF